MESYNNVQLKILSIFKIHWCKKVKQQKRNANFASQSDVTLMLQMATRIRVTMVNQNVTPFIRLIITLKYYMLFGDFSAKSQLVLLCDKSARMTL